MNEVAEMFDVDVWTIRLWANRFFDILNCSLDKEGNLLFSSKDINKIETICHFTKNRGMTLSDVRKHLLSMQENETNIANECT